MSHVQLFLSTVSEEFRSYRDALRTKLQRPNVTVHVQEDFIPTGSETLDKLDLYIKDCDAIIHLVGERTGAWAQASAVQSIKVRYPDLAERLPPLKSLIENDEAHISYTQWEAYLAVYHHKTLLIATAAPDAPRDRNFPVDPDLQSAQHAHLERLQQLGRYSEIEFSNKDQLIAEISLSAVLDLLARAYRGPQRVANVPIRVPTHFMGRDGTFGELDELLRGGNARSAVAALHGLRGVGKSTLAAAYAERHRLDYRATWWIRAQTDATMRADLVALGVRLQWVSAEEKEEAALATVTDRLRYDGDGILLIYDNALDAASLKPYLPRSGSAHVLITSNSHALRNVASMVEIGLWPPNVGADYLLARSGGEADRASGEILSEALGGLPLAHEQAAAYCERLELPLAEYRRRFEAEPARLLDDDRNAPAEYGLTVAKTFALAIEQATKLHPAAEPLIVHAGLLAPEPIPLFVFQEAREKFGEPLASGLANDGLDEAVVALRAFALVDRVSIADEHDPTIRTPTIRLHRLVRRVAQGRCEGKKRDCARRALVEAVAAVYPESVFNDPKSWPRARRLDALGLDLVNSDIVVEGAEERRADLLDALGAYKHGALAAYAQARVLKERALAIRQRLLGDDDPDTAKSLNALGLLLWDQRDLDGALPLHQRALAIREKVLGKEHADTAMSLNNLGLLLHAKGEFASAQPLFERALTIYEKAKGSEHPDTGLALNNLALVLHAKKELQAAQALYERALPILEVGLGSDHPNTNRVRRNFACLLLTEGQRDQALTFGEAALSAHEKALGPLHPWTNDSARITADALAALGRGAEAVSIRTRYGLNEDSSPARDPNPVDRAANAT
jgi:tetratricopeptide (TPR) repeat protein